MNQVMKKLMVAGLAGLAMCGSAMAAPRGNARQESRPSHQVVQQVKAPKAAQKAPVQQKVVVRKDVERKVVERKEVKCHEAPKSSYASCCDRRDRCDHRDLREHRKYDNHPNCQRDCSHQSEGWAMLGACLVSALVGGM